MEGANVIGYHYTSLSNWRRIQKEGLQPYPVNKPEIRQLFPDGINAIWVWDNNLTGNAHFGCIVFQVSTKQDPYVVKLKIKYDEDDRLHHEGKLVGLYHDGVLGNWQYHELDKAILITKPIPPEDIELIGEYDMVQLVSQNEQ